METGSVVRAIFDFCPSVSEELPLSVGDVIEVLAVVDEFWLLGKKEDVTGQFPSSFVEVVTIPSLKEGERLFVCISEFTSQGLSSLPLHRGDLVILNDDIPTAGWLQGRSCWGSRGFFPSSCVRELCLSSQSQRWHSHSALLEIPEYSMGQARALMGLSAQLEEELDFREGDVITIIGVPEPGWFEGELEGRRGIFPEGFVELLGPLRTANEAVTSGNQDDCVGNGEVDMPLGEEEKGPEEDNEQPGAYGIALYRFQALEPNELDFEVGDKIQILATLEDGWLEGCLKGKTGIFPHRFVKLCANARTVEPVALSQEGSLTKTPESSWGALENSLVVETPGHESHEYKAETTSCVLPETSTTPVNHLSPEYDINENSIQDDSTSGGIPRSPSAELEKPLAKDSDLTHYLEAVNGVSSQPQVPIHSKLQKNQDYSTAEGSHQSSEQFSNLPVEARTRDYSTLPPRRTYAPWSSQEKPLAPLHRGSSFTASRVAQPSQLSPQFEGTAKCATRHHTSKENTSSFCSTSERSERNPRPQGKGPTVAVTALSHGDGSTDLDSKLTQQLIEFEKSLSASAAEPDKILRHFSITDFNSEKDIVRGSSKLIPSQDLPERKKALRPPPPRPCTPTSTSPHLLVDQSPKPIPPLPVRPSRPAPLPPAQQRLNAASHSPSSCHRPSFKTPEKEGPEHVEQSPARTSPCPSVLARIREMEQDLDMYTRAQEELRLMLEQKQDESLRAETLENLKFYESNIESLNLGLQQLRGKEGQALETWGPTDVYLAYCYDVRGGGPRDPLKMGVGSHMDHTFPKKCFKEVTWSFSVAIPGPLRSPQGSLQHREGQAAPASCRCEQSHLYPEWPASSRNYKNPICSCKVFLGRVPWDITDAGLGNTFRVFGSLSVELGNMLSIECVLLWAEESESWVLQGRSQPVRWRDCRPKHKPFASGRAREDFCADMGKSILLITVSSES
ncbi:Dynamin-binding protein [Fukomys damarensis]|uniref:Dynamin-binding protein n=1 Tax=Fukomys damarensis TaxID=885580 RepID=A0A091D7Y4_FUKDA|nr:Dynamin-binding protein [Fukomys damarensis]